MWLKFITLMALLAVSAARDPSNCTIDNLLVCRSNYYDTCYSKSNGATPAVNTDHCYCDYSDKYVLPLASTDTQCERQGVVGGYVTSIFGKVDATLFITGFGLLIGLASFIVQIMVYRKHLATSFRNAVPRFKLP